MKHYTLHSARAQANTKTAPFHVCRFPNGTLWTEHHRTVDGYLLRFPDLADFEVSKDANQIACWPAPGATNATVEHLYQNQVFPLALSKAGKLVFHASAIEIDMGAIGFLAEAGRGKSTLAAAFSVSGHRFLTDDGLILEPSETCYRVLPSHPSIRLWRDSHERLFAPDAPVGSPVCYSSKARVMAGTTLNHCTEPRDLRAVYCLGPGTATGVLIERLSMAENLIAWAKHSFLLDIEDKLLLAAHFNQLARLANRVPCFALDYPRKFHALPSIVEAIINHESGLECL